MARQLVIELVGEAAKLKKTLNDASAHAASFGDKVANTGKKMTAFVSVPIVGFLGAATKAAMDDAAAQAHLATTIGNTIGHSKDLVVEVEAYITKAMRASTFTDDELRPAFETLATVTHNSEQSQKLLNIAMDVAAGKNISLAQATLAVAKASEGNLAAANKLVPGLVDVKNESMNAEQAVALLASTFNGQAQAATETTAGKMQILKRDLGETSEKIGTALLPALSSLATFATDTLLPALDKVSGGNGAIILLGVAAAGPVLSNIAKLKAGIVSLNLTLDMTAVKAAAALGAAGIVVGGIQTIAKEEGGIFRKVLGPSPVSRFLDRNNPLGSGGGSAAPAAAAPPAAGGAAGTVTNNVTINATTSEADARLIAREVMWNLN